MAFETPFQPKPFWVSPWSQASYHWVPGWITLWCLWCHFQFHFTAEGFDIKPSCWQPTKACWGPPVEGQDGLCSTGQQTKHFSIPSSIMPIKRITFFHFLCRRIVSRVFIRSWIQPSLPWLNWYISGFNRNLEVYSRRAYSKALERAGQTNVADLEMWQFAEIQHLPGCEMLGDRYWVIPWGINDEQPSKAVSCRENPSYTVWWPRGSWQKPALVGGYSHLPAQQHSSSPRTLFLLLFWVLLLKI